MGVVLAALVVLIIVAIFAWALLRPRKGEPFMPGDPATPKLRGIVGELERDLACVATRCGEIVGEVAARRGDSALSAADRKLADAISASAADTAGSTGALLTKIQVMTPTYSNVLAVYNGLRDSDRVFWASASTFEKIAGTISESATGVLVTCSTGLRQVARCCYSLVRNVHYLGSSLGME